MNKKKREKKKFRTKNKDLFI